jgi:hypothetical protein
LTRHIQFVGFLQVQPKLWAGTEKLALLERHICCDTALAFDNQIDPVLGDPKLLGEL